jgi:uncharacterized protein YaaN involved in tellurite resistance
MTRSRASGRRPAGDLVVSTAGDELLEELQTERLPALEAEAQASQDPLDAQRVNDVRQAVLRFERRLLVSP